MADNNEDLFPDPSWELSSQVDPLPEEGYSPDELGGVDAAWQDFINEQSGQPSEVTFTPEETLDPSISFQEQAPGEVSFTPEEADQGVDAISGADFYTAMGENPDLLQPTFRTPAAEEGGPTLQPGETSPGGELIAPTFKPEGPVDPVQLAEDQTRLANEAQIARDREFLARTQQLQADAAKEDHEMQQAQLRTQQQRHLLNQEAKALSESKPDPDHWWHDPSTTDIIRTVVGALVGGALLGPLGGVIGGFNAVSKAIDDDVDRQKDALLARRQYLVGRSKSLEEDLATQAEIHRMAEAKRAASYALLDQELATKQRLYDPESSTAQNIAQARAMAQGAITDRIIKANEDMAKQQVEMAKVEIDAYKAAQQRRLDYAKIGVEEKTASVGQQRLNYDIERSVAERTMANTFVPGSSEPVVAKNNERAKTYSETQAPASEALRLINKLEAMRAKAHGGELSGKWFGSPAGKKMLTVHSELFNAFRKLHGTGAALSENEEEKIDATIGKDGTSYADIGPTLEEAKKGLYTKMDALASDAAIGGKARWRPQSLVNEDLIEDAVTGEGGSKEDKAAEAERKKLVDEERERLLKDYNEGKAKPLGRPELK